MKQIESVEPRLLYVNTGLDRTFGGDGAIQLHEQDIVKNALGTTAGVFVDVYSGLENRRYLFKFDDRGRINQSFGRRGRVRLDVLDWAPSNLTSRAIVQSTMAFDEQTGSVYVAEQFGVASGNFSLDVERLTATGQVDTTFGTNGIASYGETAQGLSMARLVPLGGDGLLVAFNRRQRSQIGDSDAYTGLSSVSLMRLNADGRRDVTFGRRGIANVVSGGYDQLLTEFSDEVAASDVLFQDMRLEPNGSYRVVTTRNTYTQTGYYQINRTGVQYAESNAVSDSGVVDTGAAQSYILSRDSLRNQPPETTAGYRPTYAVADTSGSGISVVGGYSTDAQVVLRLSPGKRSVQAIALPDSGPTTAVVQNNHGPAFAYAGARLAKITPGVTLDPAWGNGGRLETDRGLTLLDADEAGRALLANGNTLYRFNGR